MKGFLEHEIRKEWNENAMIRYAKSEKRRYVLLKHTGKMQNKATLHN